MMRRKRSSAAALATGTAAMGIALAAVFSMAGDRGPGAKKQWAVHDMSRPQPKVVTPGTPGTQDHPGAPPSDAIVLFDGKDLSKWLSGKGGEPKWKVADGYMEITKKSDGLRTKQAFGSCQLHVEWASPKPPRGSGQTPGNSGVFLMSYYEVQVLDSYRNKTYADGTAASLYGQSPPLVNACRPPGEWQSYDIIFHRPQFAPDGKLAQPATITVLHNGVLVQDHFTIQGRSAHKRRAVYRPHPARLPIVLQDHGQPVRYRNIWIRPLD